MDLFVSYHKKSKTTVMLARKKYEWLNERDFSDESIEARYHLLEYLGESHGYTGTLEQEVSGKPIPLARTPLLHWSISHSPNFTAYIVSVHPTGIDIAEYTERHESLLDTHSPSEYQAIGEKNWQNFYRLWTGKEAIIKMIWGRLDDMKNIVFCESIDKSTDIFEFQNEMHKIHFESTDTVNMAYIAP